MTKSATWYSLVYVTVASMTLMTSLLTRGILTETPDATTNANIANLRNQMTSLATRMDILDRSIVQLAGRQAGFISLNDNMIQLNSTVQTGLNGVHTSQAALGREFKELNDNITQASREFQMLDDSMKRLTARVDQISEDCSTVEKDNSIACPAGFYYSTDGARCYKAILEAMTWYAARSRCLAEAPGAQLVTVTDAGKNTAVVKLINSVKVRYADAYNNKCRGYFWTSGRRLNDNCNSELFWQPTPDVYIRFAYMNWLWDEPTCNLQNHEHCVHYGSYGLKAWNDFTCGTLMCLICEYY